MIWANYFRTIAHDVSLKSSCLSRSIGAVLVDSRNRIISTGYNGPPMNFPSCFQRLHDDDFLREQVGILGKGSLCEAKAICPRQLAGLESGEGLNMCTSVHAEMNALINARETPVGATLFVNSQIPCQRCLVHLINAGIETIWVTDEEVYDQESHYILAHCDINIKIYPNLGDSE